MKELITRVSEATGLDDATAQTAIGHVLAFMLDHGGGSNVAEFVGKIPGAHQAIEAAAATGDAAALRQFIAHAEGYISLLREHIYKEDHVLFQLADRTLSEADQQGLSAAFGKVEAEEMGLGTHERCLRLAEELAKRYGVTGPTAFTPGGHFHCGHIDEG